MATVFLQSGGCFQSALPFCSSAAVRNCAVSLLCSIARSRSGPNEVAPPPALEPQEFNSENSVFSFAFLPSVVLCFHCLSALLAHSPALFPTNFFSQYHQLKLKYDYLCIG